MVKTIENFIEKTGQTVSWLSLILVVLISADVALRYIFNWSSSANQEMEWHIFATLFLLGSAYSLKHGKHVRVDVFYANYSERTKAWVNLIGSLLFLLPFCFVIFKTSLSFVSSSWQISESSAEPGGLPYRFLIKSMIPLSALLLFLQGTVESIRSFQSIQKTK